jgi:hypothetical protein
MQDDYNIKGIKKDIRRINAFKNHRKISHLETLPWERSAQKIHKHKP